MALQQSDAVTRTSLAEVAGGQRRPRTRRLGQMKTALRSFLVLKHLTPTQVDAFMDSYVIYSLDWADEKTMLETLGPNYQKKVGACLADYYLVINHLCAIGKLEKMYIPPISAIDPNADIVSSQILYEELIATELKISGTAKVLDLGCGRGRIAAHIAKLSGASVTGLNIDADQVASAEVFNKRKGLTNKFVCADFNDSLPFDDDAFDAFYQVQAFSLSKDIPALCRELFRVLKPGSRLSLLDWAQLPAFDPKSTHHQQLMRAIKPLIGAVGTPTPVSLVNALESAGFRVLQSCNASLDGLQAPLIEKADRHFRMTRQALLALVRVGLLPPHFRTLFNRLTRDCDAFVEADRMRLVTTSWHWLAEKPGRDDLSDFDKASGASTEHSSTIGVKGTDSTEREDQESSD